MPVQFAPSAADPPPGRPEGARDPRAPIHFADVTDVQGAEVQAGRFRAGRELTGGGGRAVWAGTELPGDAPVRIERAPERADFGSGYSSLGQLRRLPVDMLKIDRELAEARSSQATALLRAVVELGNGLGLMVVAEGVERQDQLALVRGVGCALGQGWLWARPMGIADVATLLGP